MCNTHERHSVDEMTERLNREWERCDGYLGMLRQGIDDDDMFLRLLSLLNDIRTNMDRESDFLNKNLVRLLWFVPLFMSWQAERVEDSGGSKEELERKTQQVLALLYDILGVP
jgi:hypothetical protein